MGMVAAALLALGGADANAGAFESPECQGATSVLQPDSGSPLGKIDGGFLLNEDCTAIFVKPPLVGSTTFVGFVPSVAVRTCPAVLSSTATINALMARGEKLGQKIAAGEATSEEIADFTQVQAALRALLDNFARLAAAEGLQANLLLTLEWNNLLGEYRRLNEQNYFVTGLPVEAGVLSFNLTTVERALLLVDANVVPTALEIDVPGIKFNGLENFNIAAEPQDNAVIFGNSINGFVRLTLAGACDFYDSEIGNVTPRGSTDEMAGARLVANYTFVYRLESAATYTMEFDASAIGEIVQREVQRRNGNVTAGSLSEALFDVQQTSTFRINIDDPRGILDSEKLREGFMSRVRESFAHDLLSKFSEAQSVDLPPDQSNLNLTGFREETHKARHCRRKWGIFKSCSDHVYKVKIRTQQVKERVRKLIADDFRVRYGESGKQVTSFLVADTVAMSVGVEEE
ncbi:hypothetical protein [Pelagibius sp. Alg239-R121]|uniref:hypothetical protein n=1 Tax=Pelagibius sp. Alg239-R121 TaxID=2993448 RepID=UPI0024A6B651|nr:hypothetical protein [Pelagibius sp. Alg239-R121]